MRTTIIDRDDAARTLLVGEAPTPAAPLEDAISVALGGLDEAAGMCSPEHAEWRARFVRVRVLLAKQAGERRGGLELVR